MHPVYVPRSASLSIAPGSGITGRRAAPIGSQRLTVYYEGNLQGSVNVVTFADRVLQASERMDGRYPTTATLTARTDDFVRVGRFDGSRVFIDPPVENARLLAEWLFGDRERDIPERELVISKLPVVP